MHVCLFVLYIDFHQILHACSLGPGMEYRYILFHRKSTCDQLTNTTTTIINSSSNNNCCCSSFNTIIICRLAPNERASSLASWWAFKHGTYSFGKESSEPLRLMDPSCCFCCCCYCCSISSSSTSASILNIFYSSRSNGRANQHVNNIIALHLSVINFVDQKI